MKPPVLDREITIEQISRTQDSTYGTDIVTWIALSYLPGSPLVAERFPAALLDVRQSRTEFVDQGVNLTVKRASCVIRWRDDIDASMRVIVHSDDDAIYNIKSPPAEVFGRKAYIEFMIERGSSDA